MSRLTLREVKTKKVASEVHDVKPETKTKTEPREGVGIAVSVRTGRAGQDCSKELSTAQHSTGGSGQVGSDAVRRLHGYAVHE
jgi:hypothetical protein